mmetsp:Transcript_9734/g.18677  ORF Transcript_9734/g.18677 Transcript_9734/m.18677 type:complete len:292 (+) Transcript_9734:1024-1899(+)
MLADMRTSSDEKLELGLVVAEGYLQKRGWLAPTFRSRYFYLYLPAPHGEVLCPYLSYYLNKGHPNKRGTIALSEGKVCLLTSLSSSSSASSSDERTFAIKMKNGKSLVLRAATREHAAKWVKALSPLMTKPVLLAIKALRARMDRFDITHHEYHRILGKIATITMKDANAAAGASVGDGAGGANALLKNLTERSRQQEAHSLRRWAIQQAQECPSLPSKQVHTLSEIATVLGKHLADGSIAQEDYDQIVKESSELMFSKTASSPRPSRPPASPVVPATSRASPTNDSASNK